MNDIRVSQDFKLREFQCRHCQLVKLDEKLLQKLQAMRNAVQRPLTILSGYRCPEHNKAVGGAQNSQHLHGTAADVRVPPDMTVDQLAAVAEDLGFDGIGRYYKQGFIHVDVRGFRSRWTD